MFHNAKNLCLTLIIENCSCNELCWPLRWLRFSTTLALSFSIRLRFSLAVFRSDWSLQLYCCRLVLYSCSLLYMSLTDAIYKRKDKLFQTLIKVKNKLESTSWWQITLWLALDSSCWALDSSSESVAWDFSLLSLPSLSLTRESTAAW